jgi:Hint domain
VTIGDASLELAAQGSPGIGPITFEPGPAALVLESAAQPVDGVLDNWLYDFGADDSVDLAGLKYTGVNSVTPLSLTEGVLMVAEDGQTESFTLGDPGATAYFAHDDGNGGTLVDVACYARGTRILTGRGEVAVEALSLDDLVITASGCLRPIRWIGHRAVDCSRHPDPNAVQPVRVARDAFGEGLPSRELWLSPGHNIAHEGALVPISALVNGVSVAQVQQRRVEYWHVELFGHDVLVAEGLPAESYLDTGNRTAFAGGGAFIEAHPDFKPKHWADTCLPLALEGAPVIRAKARLIARLIEQGYRIDHEADAHVLADGRRVEPTHVSETRLAFVLPRARNLTLCSNVFVPAHIRAECADFRELGLCIGRLQIDHDVIALESDQLPATEWSELERANEGLSFRWTTGAVSIRAGARVIVVDLANQGSYWREPNGGGAMFVQSRRFADGARHRA